MRDFAARVCTSLSASGDHLAHVNIFFGEIEAARFRFGDVQDVVDDFEQVFAALLDVPDIPHILVRHGTEGLLPNQLGEPDDRIQRRSQLVARRGQKLGLGPIGGLSRILGVQELFSDRPLDCGLLDQRRLPHQQPVVGECHHHHVNDGTQYREKIDGIHLGSRHPFRFLA